MAAILSQQDYAVGMENLEGDKFSEADTSWLPEQIQWKLYRCKKHFMEFETEASTYMNQGPCGPGEIMHAAESTPEIPMIVYAPAKPVPARFGLIVGDYLQNLRSVFDYLAWDLVLANGKTPDERNTAFPVCRSHKAWNGAKERCFVGIDPKAVKIIELIQPFPERDPSGRPQTIHILDELNNSNKHRRVLSTLLATILKPVTPVPFPHIELEVVRHRGGDSIPGERLLAYLAFESPFIKGVEVTATMSALMDWMVYDVLPQFKRFF